MTTHTNAPGRWTRFLWVGFLFTAGPVAVAAPRAPAVVSPAVVPGDGATARAIALLEERVRRDPDNFVVQNMLAGYYLRRVRETGDHAHLASSLQAARASLAAIPAEGNPGGLAALAMAEAASHDFATAARHGERLVQIAPNKSYTHEILGDALLEAGDYEKAGAAYQKMVRLKGASVNSHTRLGRLALLRGDPKGATGHFTAALALAESLSPPPPEVVAWCQWQLGDTAFSVGDYPRAERSYREALVSDPRAIQVMASLGRLLAARGDLAGAIAEYERAVAIDPMPVFVAALGDLYALAGRPHAAAAQYDQILRGPRNELDTRLDNRQLVLFYADHDLRAEVAYAGAAKEYETRRDVYGADAVAWTALKAGKLPEAREAIHRALRLGTKDARLLYHAGMIAEASGDRATAVRLLDKALALNPRFDPLQAGIARKHRDRMSSPER